MPSSNKKRNTHPLRIERLQRQWTQQQLAEHIGAAIVTVKRWERWDTVPSPYFRLKLTALFGKSEEELGLGEEHSSLPTSFERKARSEEQRTPVSTDISSVWTVPYRRNPYFTGRDDLFCFLDECLASTTQTKFTMTCYDALTQPLALTGLGGIGKTQIAVEYAYRAYAQGKYAHVLWINAAGEEAILASFTSLAALLPTFPAANETNQQKLVDAVKQWLERCMQSWLLIFDNADDLSSIQNYFPRYGNGSLLLTTRAHAVGSLALAVEVEKMSFIEGECLLLRRSQRVQQMSDEKVNAVEHLVRILDHFPLALDQAGAYIEETGCTFDMYLHLYQTHRRALLARRGAQATNYPESIFTTWSLSFQMVKQANPAAAQLLQLCAFLAPDHIPEELLKEGASYWPAPLQQAVEDPFTFNQLLEVLFRFSFIKRLTEDRMLSIHRLIQVVQLDMIDPEEQSRWAERIVHVVNNLFPCQPNEDVSSWPQCLRYLEQVQACMMLIEQYRLQISEAADLLDRAGVYLRIHASYPLAEAFYQQVLCLHEKLWKRHHLETARTLNNLGMLCWQQGKYEQVEPYYDRALYICEEQLGTHPETAKILHNLGILYYYRGEYEQAEAYYQRSLSLREKLLGTHHPETAGTQNNLGFLYTKQGKYEQADTYYHQALVTQEEHLGVHHPETAKTLNNLGFLYMKQENYEQAEACYRRALLFRKELLGIHHPETAITLSNLGFLYMKQENYEQAEAYYHQALAIQEAQLGSHHPEVAEILHNLGVLYYQQGKYEQANAHYHQALAVQEVQLGVHHPETARTLDDLAKLYETQDKHDEALEKAVSIDAAPEQYSLGLDTTGDRK